MYYCPATLIPLYVLSMTNICPTTKAEVTFDVLSDALTLGFTDAMIRIVGDTTAALEKFDALSFQSQDEKTEALVSALISHTERTQQPLVLFLEGQGVKYEQLWITNMLVVRQATIFQLLALNTFSEVSSIGRVPVLNVDPPLGTTEVVKSCGGTPWGIRRIDAIRARQKFNTNGAGVVVGVIDTGAEWKHVALKDNWRTDNGWFDPTTFTAKPFDKDGHGTHVTGTIVGRVVGVAPEAQWIACQGCPDGCPLDKILLCAAWVMCPTSPTDHVGVNTTKACRKGANVVNNSYGGLSGEFETSMNFVIEAWNRAGMHHTFSIGNEGRKGCRTTLSPGNQTIVFAVGATTEQDQRASFSSLGPAGPAPPSLSSYIKPDVSAPGQHICSAWNKGVASYQYLNGTSMASPHVAGLLALMVSFAGPNKSKLAPPLAANIVERSTSKNLIMTNGVNCDGNKVGFPNNEFGFGLINCMKALNLAKKLIFPKN